MFVNSWKMHLTSQIFQFGLVRAEFIRYTADNALTDLVEEGTELGLQI